jgi:hypothetical protein
MLSSRNLFSNPSPDTPKVISLSVCSAVTFDPPQNKPPFGVVKMIGGDTKFCTTAQQVRQAFYSASNKNDEGGVFTATISGTLDNRKINQAFNNLNALKSFLMQNGFKMPNGSELCTQKELLDEANRQVREKIRPSKEIFEELTRELCIEEPRPNSRPGY